MEVSPSATSVAHTNGVVLRSVESVPRFTADIIPRIISAARLTRSVLRFSGVQRNGDGGGWERRSVTESARPQISIETEVDDDDARQESKSTRQIGGNTVGTRGGGKEEKERKRGTR